MSGTTETQALVTPAPLRQVVGVMRMRHLEAIDVGYENEPLWTAMYYDAEAAKALAAKHNIDVTGHKDRTIAIKVFWELLQVIDELSFSREYDYLTLSVRLADDQVVFAGPGCQFVLYADSTIGYVSGQNPLQLQRGRVYLGQCHDTPASRWREAGEPDPFEGRYLTQLDRSQLAKGDLSDDEVANGIVYYHRELDGLSWATAAQERIRWLSRHLDEANAKIERLQNTPSI